MPLRRTIAALLCTIACALAAPARAQSVITDHPDPSHEILSQEFQTVTDARSLSRLTGGNHLELLQDGVRSFPRKYALLQSATRTAFVSTMVWANDAAGNHLADELIAAKKRGVDARALVDGILSSGAIVKRLREAGVKVAQFHRLIPFSNAAHHRGRLHWKTVIVDFDRAIVGGMNVSDAWELGDGEDRWLHDSDVLVEGPCAAWCARRFLELYQSLDEDDHSVGMYLADPSLEPPPAPRAGREGMARLVINEPDRQDECIVDCYRRMFAAAKTQIVWHCMEFFPASKLLPDLAAAAKRGVRVVLITQSQAAMEKRGGTIRDFQFVAEELERRKLRGLGIEVWEIDVPLHSKAMTIDGVVASVGSFNCDWLSSSLNVEGTIVGYDPSFVAAVEGMLERDLKRARRVTK